MSKSPNPFSTFNYEDFLPGPSMTPEFTPKKHHYNKDRREAKKRKNKRRK